MFEEKEKDFILKVQRNAAFSRFLIDRCSVASFKGTNFLSVEVFKDLSLILSLKLTLLANFRYEFRVFQILGPRLERPFCPMLLFRKGLSSYF